MPAPASPRSASGCWNEGWAFCTLFTDLGNPTSNKIYQQIGYRPVCDFTEIRFAI
jgi:predicted GNAT family acetyltransferase